MQRAYLKFALILLIPVIIGVWIGFSLGSGDSPQALDESFQKSFPSVQQTSLQDQITSSRRNAITQAVASVSPAILGINVTEVREFRDPFSRFFGDDPFFRQFFGDRTYRQEVKGLGSGFFISPDGYIVTNDHVAGNATEITITLTGGKRMSAQLIGTDPATDVTLLKVDGKDLPYVKLGNSDDIVVGEWAIALGNPFGLFEINDKPTVTVGVISSTGMNLGRIGEHFYKDMIETDAAINGGNSGGPLVNSLGEVIGVNTLIYTAGQSSTFVGYGFAIPINKVKKIVTELKNKGKIVRDVWVGFEAQQVDNRIARYFGLSKVEGIILSEIQLKSPAEKAGLKVGDIIVEINGDRINATEDLSSILVDANAGDVLNIKFYRERKTLTAQLKLERQPS
ncbi:MAG: trypsin-like peptidase domain-containing protein [Ignavibacteriales bacterium]|nr:trypsin-like peptidase domain-containing protein [Ignavibacteriales bacterium]